MLLLAYFFLLVLLLLNLGFECNYSSLANELLFMKSKSSGLFFAILLYLE